ARRAVVVPRTAAELAAAAERAPGTARAPRGARLDQPHHLSRGDCRLVAAVSLAGDPTLRAAGGDRDGAALAVHGLGRSRRWLPALPRAGVPASVSVRYRTAAPRPLRAASVRLRASRITNQRASEGREQLSCVQRATRGSGGVTRKPDGTTAPAPA